MAEVPLPAGDLQQALGAWRSRLAVRGSGLVPIAGPTAFQWAGWWLPVVHTADTEVATVAFGTPPGIVLSPQDPTLLGRATADLPIIAAYALASLDPVLRAATATATPELHGVVEGLAVAPAAEAEMRLLQAASARAGRDGDRYAAGAGTFSPRAGHRLD